MPQNPIAFEIFGRPIYKYGLIVTSAIICAFLLYLFLAKKRKIDIDFSLELFIWIVLLAVLCCRLFYVIPRKEFFPEDFGWDDFVRIFDISTGGLTIIGGIFGGALGIFLCCLRNRKYSFATVADCVVIALLLGQIIGRWGNFFNQELYGQVVSDPKWQFFPFAVYIELTGEWHNALFFYEGVINSIGLIIMLVCFFKFGNKIKPFTFSLAYIAWYNLVRASLEFLKYEHLTFPGTNIGVIQVICFIIAPIAIVLCILNQLGKISFETKWFKNMCEKHQAELVLKAEKSECINSEKENSIETSESTNESSEINLEEININKVISDNIENDNKINDSHNTIEEQSKDNKKDDNK